MASIKNAVGQKSKKDFEGTTRIEAAGNGTCRDFGCISSNHVRMKAFDDVYKKELTGVNIQSRTRVLASNTRYSPGPLIRFSITFC